MSRRHDTKADQSPSGNNKIDRYGWRMEDGPGVFLLVSKGRLNVDRLYQRPATNAKVLKIASAWSWIACGTLVVARRSDGTLWVVDGQHRKLAADKRADILELPCIEFDIDDATAEAHGFFLANTHRGPLKGTESFKSEIVAEHEIACKVQEMVESTGYMISDSDARSTVRCARKLLKAMEISEVRTRRVWHLCVEVCRGEKIQDKIFGALFFLAGYLQSRGDDSLFAKHNRDCLSKAGPAEILVHINKAAGYFGKGGEKVWAQGVVNLLNHKRSTRRLPPPMAE